MSVNDPKRTLVFEPINNKLSQHGSSWGGRRMAPGTKTSRPAFQS